MRILDVLAIALSFPLVVLALLTLKVYCEDLNDKK